MPYLYSVVNKKVLCGATYMTYQWVMKTEFGLVLPEFGLGITVFGLEPFLILPSHLYFPYRKRIVAYKILMC